MNKKKMIFAFLSMILSVFAFVVATYAWFAVSTSVSNSPLDLNVDPGIVPYYEVHYYTLDDIYKTTSNNSNIYVYDSGWTLATHTEEEDTSVLSTVLGENYDPNTFYGLIMKPYDPLIPANNLVNNLIIGLYLEYEVEVNTNVSLTAIVDEAIGHASRDAFGITSGSAEELYYSQVVNVQITPESSTDTYGFHTAGTNLYSTLTTLFENDTTYPYSEFYDGSDNHTTSLAFYNEASPLLFTATSGSFYIYFNFSYNQPRIDTLLSGLISGGFGDINIYRFFQDITLVIRKESEVS